MPILSADGESLYITAYSFRVVLQPIGTNPRAGAQELFLTIKNPPAHRARPRRGTTPARILSTAPEHVPVVRPGVTPAKIKPAPGKKSSRAQPGTTPRRVKPGESDE